MRSWPRSSGLDSCFVCECAVLRGEHLRSVAKSMMSGSRITRDESFPCSLDAVNEQEKRLLKAFCGFTEPIALDVHVCENVRVIMMAYYYFSEW
jgi:hypothetical protein